MVYFQLLFVINNVENHLYFSIFESESSLTDDKFVKSLEEGDNTVVTLT
jgi:hypothetical protein